MFSLEGKNAIVIGGTKGLGKGIATGLSQAGATVAVSSRNQEDCTKAALEIGKKTGKKTLGIGVDITQEKSICALVQSVIKELGNIHILVNCAGINIRKPAVMYTQEDWDTVQNIQLKGVFFTCQAVAKHMINEGICGRIINIASINAKIVARPDIVSYVAAKAGIMQMTKALAVEWADYGITVNAIAPGFFETELTKVLFENPATRDEILRHVPCRRFGNPEKDLAGMAVYYASDASEYTTGQIIYIDGGYTSI